MSMNLEDKHAPDLQRLHDWWRAKAGSSLAAPTAQRFGDGQSNPTYLVRFGRQAYVLRRRPLGPLLPSAHAIDREFRVIGALHGAGLPVPSPEAYCADTEVLGSAFYLMEYVQGRHFTDPALPGMAPQERAALYGAINAAIARLHSVDPAAVGLADFGRPGNFFERQIDRWTRQYHASPAPRIAAMDAMVEALPALIPKQRETRIAHGDFRIDNLIFAADAPRVIAILDWELSTLGDPVSDFAYHMMVWQLPRETYRFGIADSDLDTLGIPTERGYQHAYCRAAGRVDLPDWNFCMAFNLFRLTGVLHGIAGRAATGSASSPRAAQAAHSAAGIAEIGWRQVQDLLR